MNRKFSMLMAASIASIAGLAVAQPTLTSLGGGVPLGVTNEISGTRFIGGSGLSSAAAARWSLTGATLTGMEIGGPGGGGYISADGLFQTGQHLNTGPQIFGNTGSATGYDPNVTLTASTTLPAATEFAARRWSSASSTWTSMGGLPIDRGLLAFGSGSSGGSTGSFLTANAISATGRFTVGLGYVSTYNNAGTTVSANTFRWRPWIWDADTGIMKILPTPFKTTAGQTSLRRTGNAYAVSADGLVIAGAQEHNVGTTPNADPDGGRLVVWRWNSGASNYDMTFLPNGVTAEGFPITYSTTPSSVAMNQAGTIIACRAVESVTGNAFIGKWTWNSGTSSWDGPTNLGSALATPASWLPGSVLSCGVPPNIGGSLAMSDDGNTIVGSAVYSTCGSFMSGGFIWTAADGLIEDWYDYNVAAGTPGCSTGGFFGPTGDNGNPERGLPVLGYPTSISADGSAIVGFQGGTARIPGAPGWIWVANDGPACVAPTITTNPAASTNFSACTSSIILNVAASGTPPFTYQWYRDGSPIADGTQDDGSTVTGAASFQLRVNAPLSADDAGTYYAVVTGSCGSPAQTANAVVQVDPAFPAGSALNDTCATAQAVVEGTNVLGSGQSPCAAYNNDPNNSAFCLTTGTLKTDRWFSFTPVTTGDYRFETCGSNFDTVLSVFDGCGSSELACNNDLNIGPSVGCSANRSRIGSITLQANQSYLIRIAAPVSAFLSGTSVMNLSISAAPAPAPNDTCDTATVATLGANPFNTTEATNDYIAICNTSASRDVWFTYTPSGYGKLIAKTCVTPASSTFNTVLTVFDGCNGNEIGCNDDAGISGCSSQSIVSDLSVSPSTYVFRIAGASPTNFGAGVLTLEFICFADFNQDGGVTGEDVEAFFLEYEAGSVLADVNLDGGVTGDDVQTFFELFEAGGC